MMPAIAVALVAILSGAALVVDRLWLDTAHTELRTAAEAAALAAGRELANDDLLREHHNRQSHVMKARLAAARIAAENFAIGDPLLLNTDDDGDVRIGRLSIDEITGESIFIETNENPTTVVVSARRTNDRQWPVSLPFRTLAGPNSADVVAIAEASLDNHVVGLRSIDNLPIPTLPIAILSDAIQHVRPISKQSKKPNSRTKPNADNNSDGGNDERGDSMPTWKRDIERRRGNDRFAFDPIDGTVSEEQDGIPEIVLRTVSPKSKTPDGNAFVVALRTDLTNDDLRYQIANGWSAHDLEPFDGELMLNHGSLTLTGLRGVDAGTVGESLRRMIGQPRACLLYDQADVSTNSQVAQLRCIGIVAGRVMSATEISENVVEIVLQPTVMTSRSAVVASEVSGANSPAASSATETENKEPDGQTGNRYLYKLRLTN
ncbi:MAG: hypothetical protein NT013_21750 [Planctomycetia bacterium]|nr:hypothetical protein [Planctomycetia bacterium]